MKSKLSRIYLRIHVELKSLALLSSNLPSVIHRSNLSPSRKAFHFYFYSNNDPTSPKGPSKQKTEPILGTQCMPIIFMTHRLFSVILSSHIY